MGDIEISDTIFIYKNGKLHGKLNHNGCYRLNSNDEYVLDNELYNKIIDILPEGIDLKIMIRKYGSGRSNDELFPYLKNTIGVYDFSYSDKGVKPRRFLSSIDENIVKLFTPVNLKLYIDQEALFPNSDTIYSGRVFSKNLSISGYQHKLQVYIKDGIIQEGYGDFILKPSNNKYLDLEINEHFHTSFMRELGFKVPLNFIIKDENNHIHYMIKRFDILEDGSKIEMVSLNGLFGGDKYSGSCASVMGLLTERNILDKEERLKLLRYLYSNILLYNSDLHRKNISLIKVNERWMLSPAYDIINTDIYSLLENKQCCLDINNKTDNIKIRDFRGVIHKLKLDYEEALDNLEDIKNIYFEKYPLYLNKLSKFNSKLTNLFEISYEKNKLADIEKQRNVTNTVNSIYKNNIYFDRT